MCGIAGVFGPSKPEKVNVDKTLHLMTSRGPDATGVFEGRLQHNQITLLHSRLSIIDLEQRSNQPFEKDGYVLCFNGEIYNYKEIRHTLRKAGHDFLTESDTEVIIEAYRHWGKSFTDKLEGMWAFALYDSKNEKFILSRDRFGEKPLYYALKNGSLFFASETSFLRALCPDSFNVNYHHVKRFLVNGYKALNKKTETFFEGISSFPAACSVVIDQPNITSVGQNSPIKYWELKYQPRTWSENELIDRTKEIFSNAVNLRLRSDVPIAFCLSGGVDSTALASYSKKIAGQNISAFSIYDKDERYNETQNIEEIVKDLQCEHFPIHTSQTNFLGRLRKIVRYTDSPLATISFYVQDMLCEQMHANGYKVAITGNGADELFTGYYDHYNFWFASVNDATLRNKEIEEWKSGFGAHVRNPVLKDPNSFINNPYERGHIFLERDVFNSVMHEPFSEDHEEFQYSSNILRSRMLNEIWHETIPLMMNQNDLIFMRHSIEGRSPYLDRNLAEHLFSVPTEMLMKDGYSKWLLRSASEGILIDKIRLNKHKQGFNTSLDSLFDLNNKENIDWLLSENRIFDIINREKIQNILQNFDGRNSWKKFLFSFISTRLFFEEIKN